MLEKTRDGASSVVSRTSSLIYNTAGESVPGVYKEIRCRLSLLTNSALK